VELAKAREDEKEKAEAARAKKAAEDTKRRGEDAAREAKAMTRREQEARTYK